MNDINELFFSLIRVAIGTQDTLPHAPSAEEWKQLYDMAKKQSLIGICFAALQKLALQRNENEYENENRIHSKGPEAKPAEYQDLEPCEVMAKYWNMPEMLYLKWMGMAAKIQQRNEIMNDYSLKTLEYFRSHGLPCYIMKGQAISALYKNANSEGKNFTDLSMLRQSGDIDVWVNCSRDNLLSLSKRELGKVEGLNNMYHCHYPMFDDCEIEAHFLPTTINSPFKNRAFKKFCSMHAPMMGADVPSQAFNRVYIMLHGFHHLVGHGCGLRQLLDYYFVLKQGFTEEERGNTMRWVNRLGMKRYAPALMWVMREVFGLDEQYLLCSPNEEDGRFMLHEVMETGNMGHGDMRFDHKVLGSAWGRFVHNMKRDWHMLRISQSHALWDPIMDVYQFVWKSYLTKKWNK